jgi:hypothetical protein
MTGVIVDEKYIVGHTALFKRCFKINITAGAGQRLSTIRHL